MTHEDPNHRGLKALDAALEMGNMPAARRAVEDLTDPERLILGAQLGPDNLDRVLETVRRTQGAKKAGRVIVIHGILGGLLDAVREETTSRIWRSWPKLFGGGMSELELTPDLKPARPDLSIRVAGTDRSYLPLLFALDQHWEVGAFAYDWRLDIDEAAKDLDDRIQRWAEGEPVHLVAHSMGGLVARRLIQMFPRTWGSMDQGGTRGGRLIMLGTPNRGSFAIPMMLTGEERLVRLLGLLDQRNDVDGLRRIIATFPGPYQMMPSPDVDQGDHRAQLFDPKNWSDDTVIAQHLDRAKQFHQELREVRDPHRLIYVAGYGQRTVHRIRIENGNFTYQRTRHGDGRVPHELGLLDGVPTFWIETEHGELHRDERLLNDIDELLEHGTASGLKADPPRIRALAEGKKWKTADELEPIPRHLVRAAQAAKGEDGAAAVEDHQTTRAEIDRLLESRLTEDYLGAGAPLHRQPSKVEKPPALAHPLTIEVVWGDIVIGARGDFYCVGHYEGVLPRAAELALDRAVSGIPPETDRVEENKLLLTRLTRQGILRGRLGDIDLFPWHGDHGRTVAVVGMGHAGGFTEGRLRRDFRCLVTKIGGLPGCKTICTVLIGAGNGGLSPREAVRGLIRGLADGLQQNPGSPIERLCVVECSLRKAGEIYHLLSSCKDLEPRLNVQLKGPKPTRSEGAILTEDGLALALAAAARARKEASGEEDPVKTILAGLPKDQRSAAKRGLESLAPGGDVEDIARGLEIRIGNDAENEASRLATRISYTKRDGVIRASVITHTTVVPEREIRLDGRRIDRLIERARKPDHRNLPELSRHLTRVLIPPEFRDRISFNDPIIFDVDREMAAVPWEMLATDPGSDTFSCIGLEAHVARQLRTTYSAAAMRQDRGRARRALVIGDPGDPDRGEGLEGAREEARTVVRILQDLGFEVHALIGAPDARDRGPVRDVTPATHDNVVSRLNEQDYDILHYAGHGEYDDEHTDRLGWVFSEGMFTAANLEEVERPLPRLIVANACHSARVSRATASGSATGVTKSERGLLPALVDQFFRKGAQSYIGTAWPVNDEGAIVFAREFYEMLFKEKRKTKSSSIGAAMHHARQKLGEAAPEYGTLWAAYQYYGDPTTKV